MNNDKVYKMTFATVYPLLVQKAERKGRHKIEVDEAIYWLTGYDKNGLQLQIDKQATLETFWNEVPQINPNADKIAGTICGYKIQEIADPIVQNVRRLDKLVDEIAKGKPMEKVLRK